MNFSPRQSWADWLVIIGFVVLLGVPTLDTFFYLDTTAPRDENRRLAPRPPAPDSWADWQALPAGWEKYFNDHFGCRRCLMMWQRKLKWSWLREKNLRQDALIGRDGWLYLASPGMVENYCGSLSFSPAELVSWQRLLERRQAWLAARDIQFVFVIAPDKQSIYPEYLPIWLAPLRGTNRLDQLLDFLREHSTVPVLDLRPALLAAKKLHPTYLMTDTHWNQFGAFTACQTLEQFLTEKRLPARPPLLAEAFEMTTNFKAVGDLTRFLGMDMLESNAPTMIPKPTLPHLLSVVVTNTDAKPMTIIKNPLGTGRGIVYHDSFGAYWVPFLGYLFGEVDFIPQSGLDLTPLAPPKPQVVIMEVVERFLNTANPKQLLDQDNLP